MGFISQTSSVANPTKMVASFWVNIPQSSFDAGGGRVPIWSFGSQASDAVNSQVTIIKATGFTNIYVQIAGAANSATLTTAAGSGPATPGLSVEAITPNLPAGDVGHEDDEDNFVDMISGWNQAVGSNFIAGRWNHIALSVDVTGTASVTNASSGDDSGSAISPYTLNSSYEVFATMNGVDCSPTAVSMEGIAFLGTGPGSTNVNGDPNNVPPILPVRVTGIIPATRGRASCYRVSGGARAPVFPLTRGNQTVGQISTMSAWQIATNGFGFGLPIQANAFGNQIIRMGHVRIWYGQHIDVHAQNSLFCTTLSGGLKQPADPALAQGVLGVETYSFNGTKTGFPINLGSGGAMTTTGTLSNFSPSPSFTS